MQQTPEPATEQVDLTTKRLIAIEFAATNIEHELPRIELIRKGVRKMFLRDWEMKVPPNVVEETTDLVLREVAEGLHTEGKQVVARKLQFFHVRKAAIVVADAIQMHDGKLPSDIRIQEQCKDMFDYSRTNLWLLRKLSSLVKAELRERLRMPQFTPPQKPKPIPARRSHSVKKVSISDLSPAQIPFEKVAVVAPPPEPVIEKKEEILSAMPEPNVSSVAEEVSVPPPLPPVEVAPPLVAVSSTSVDYSDLEEVIPGTISNQPFTARNRIELFSEIDRVLARQDRDVLAVRYNMVKLCRVVLEQNKIFENDQKEIVRQVLDERGFEWSEEEWVAKPGMPSNLEVRTPAPLTHAVQDVGLKQEHQPFYGRQVESIGKNVRNHMDTMEFAGVPVSIDYACKVAIKEWTGSEATTEQISQIREYLKNKKEEADALAVKNAKPGPPNVMRQESITSREAVRKMSVARRKNSIYDDEVFEDRDRTGEADDYGEYLTYEEYLAMGIDAHRPTRARPGSDEKVLMISARYAAGVPLWHDDDLYDQEIIKNLLTIQEEFVDEEDDNNDEDHDEQSDAEHTKSKHSAVPKSAHKDETRQSA